MTPLGDIPRRMLFLESAGPYPHQIPDVYSGEDQETDAQSSRS